MARRIALRFAFTGFLILTAAAASAQPPGGQPPPPVNPNAIVPGEFVIEPPTLINLGFEWFIQGDDNRNASVAVSYRKTGRHRRGSTALPLLRLQGERIYSESRVDVIAPNMFAGSILDLEPDTAYEAQFVMSDPDGVHRRSARRRCTVRTRAEPMPYAGGRVFHVYPHGFKGDEDRAVVRRADVRLQRLVRRHRLGDVAAGRACGPATRSWCTPALYKYNRYEYTNDAVGQPHRAARRHLLPDRRRHAGDADRDQGAPATAR